MLDKKRGATRFGVVIWITGLSGAGKSTLAKDITQLLRVAGKPAVLLDGDELREVLGVGSQNNINFSRARRLDLALRYSNFCRMLASQGLFVVIATISLFKEVHRWNRENHPAYFEVYLKASMEQLRRRDSKGIYKRFDAGELRNVAGLDLHIDEPEMPDLLIPVDELDSRSNWAATTLNHLKKRELL